MNKFILYLFVLPLVIYTMDSVNFNSIFKKNKVFQARIFYILVMFSLSYLVCNYLIKYIHVVILCLKLVMLLLKIILF